MLSQITPLILTFNEAPNIGRVLERLTWAARIVVLDSFSSDDTEAICRKFPQVEFIQRTFDDHTSQWNFGLDRVQTDWVLTLDADYVLSEPLVEELHGWQPGEAVAWFARFRYRVFGKPLRASLYPPRAVLFWKAKCRYESDGHTQRLVIRGATAQLTGVIFHDDRKPFSHWLWAQERYTTLEVKKLLRAAGSPLSMPDRLRKMILPAPVLVLFYTLFIKGLILEGWRGWFYAGQRVLAEVILSLRLIEQKLKR